jgi:2-keto-4-pentenoate hydratase/2-oxohepta-3-ene-1,7-dioic acid hydratase in catechol pathway
MRLITFTTSNQSSRLGAWLANDQILDLNLAEPLLPANMLDFLNRGQPALEMARRVITQPPARALLPIAAVQILAPVPNPGKIICMGHNYLDHIGIGRTAPAEYPNFFCKTPNTIIGPGQAIVIPPVSEQVDYEAELAVVIGRAAHRVSEEQVMDCVAGYTIFNDVSARDYQKRTTQWFLGKSFDTFGPMGPTLVTADEIPDPHTLELSLTLNGQEMQRTNTGNMIFSIAFQISYLSQVMTLEPGDILSTGTPAKTELAKSLPPFMKAGDRVSICIENIGELSNPIVAEEIIGL